MRVHIRNVNVLWITLCVDLGRDRACTVCRRLRLAEGAVSEIGMSGNAVTGSVLRDTDDGTPGATARWDPTVEMCGLPGRSRAALTMSGRSVR